MILECDTEGRGVADGVLHPSCIGVQVEGGHHLPSMSSSAHKNDAVTYCSRLRLLVCNVNAHFKDERCRRILCCAASFQACAFGPRHVALEFYVLLDVIDYLLRRA